MELKQDYRSFKAFKEIYSLTNTQLITPENLLSNIELPNFRSIKYSKIDEELIVEISCELENAKEAQFIYSFDSRRFLQTVLSKVEGDGCSILFERESSIAKAKNNFRRSLAEKVV